MGDWSSNPDFKRNLCTLLSAIFIRLYRMQLTQDIDLQLDNKFNALND